MEPIYVFYGIGFIMAIVVGVLTFLIKYQEYQEKKNKNSNK
jgi:hypothetical protein